MSTPGRRNGTHRLDLDADEPYVVPRTDNERSPGCPVGCRSPYLCPACADAVRAEALSWLRDLADDQFGFSPMDLFASDQQDFDIQVLWRDPHGVAQMSADARPPRRH